MEYIIITFAVVLMDVGIYVFKFPNNFSFGGVSGMAVVFSHFIPMTSAQINLVINLILLVIGFIVLGRDFGVKTAYVTVVSSLLLNVFEKVFPMEKALTGNIMLELCFAIILPALAAALLFFENASGGGTDIVAMILQKYCHIRFSKAILLVDGIVVGFGLLVIGFGIGNPDDATQPSWHLSFYSLIAIFVTSRVLAYVINGEKNDKILFVISDMRLTALHDYILKDLDRIATCIKSSGLYTNVDKEMLFLVVSYKEVVGIKQKIREVDPKAFVVVTDAYDAFGEGWKELPMAGEVQPE